MLYSNVNLNAQERNLSFGKLRCVTLGEQGRGRKEVLIPIPKNLEKVKKGLNPNLTIGLTKNGKPRINFTSKEEDKLYIIINSYGGYSRRGSGRIKHHTVDGTKELVYGLGADGDAGRIGSWYVSLFEVPNDGKRRFIEVDFSGGRESGYVISEGNNVFYIKEENLIDYFDQLDEELPKILNNRFVREGFYLIPEYEGKEELILKKLENIKQYSAEDLLKKFDRFREEDNKIYHINNTIGCEIEFYTFLSKEKVYLVLSKEEIEELYNVSSYLDYFKIDDCHKAMFDENNNLYYFEKPWHFDEYINGLKYYVDNFK